MFKFMRNVILKSFETFIAEPLSILRNKIIRITNFKSDFTSSKSISVNVFDDTVQVNVVNSQKAYNLLSAVVYKRRIHELRSIKTDENKTGAIFN